jgi:uncharacterized protein YecT (DUF1311 family)
MIAIALLLAAAPETQLDMERRARADLARADAEMNAQYRVTTATIRRWGAKPPSANYAAALLKAQRAWIDYRDAQCAVEGNVYSGGTMQGLTIVTCKARVTRTRTAELKHMLPESR